MKVINLSINNLCYKGCKENIENELNRLAAVKFAVVDLDHKKVLITYDDNLMEPIDFKRIIENKGYDVSWDLKVSL